MSRPDDRRLPVGLLFAAVAVIAVVATVRWLGSTVTSTGAEASPSDASASASSASSASSVPPAASATAAAPTASPDMPVPTVAATAGPPATSPEGTGDCGRISSTACAKAILLARKGHEASTMGATRVVVDDICPPFPTVCDRLYPFDAIVVFVTAGGDTTGWYSYRVVGREPDKPTKTVAWDGDVPNHLVAQLLTPQPSP